MPLSFDQGYERNRWQRTAKRLGNTAVCRKSYIHPAILDAYSGGRLISALEDFENKTRHHTRGLLAEELLLVQFLKLKYKWKHKQRCQK
jgi:DNA topoisomerase-1